MGGGRYLGAHASGAHRGARVRQRARAEGGLRRRELRGREKRGARIGPTKSGKGTKRLLVTDGHGTPLAFVVRSASPAEIKLVEEVLDELPPHLYPEMLIGDRGPKRYFALRATSAPAARGGDRRWRCRGGPRRADDPHDLRAQPRLGRTCRRVRCSSVPGEPVVGQELSRSRCRRPTSSVARTLDRDVWPHFRRLASTPATMSRA